MKEKINQNSRMTSDNDSRVVEGYGCVFESPSDLDLGFIEIIHRGAITEETIKNSDVFVRFNHDNNKILARSKNGTGSLELKLDNKGLHYRFEAPKTSLGDELLEYLQRGDICNSSFAFSLDKSDPNCEKWSKRNGVIYRDIYKINRLYDVAPVFTPAYSEATCSKRYIEMRNKSQIIDYLMDLKRLDIETL